LRQGGNACDAALAVSVVQTVVEPHMTTITGVLSLLYYDGRTGATTYMNGGVNRPLADLPGFSVDDLSTGRGVSVPGWWAGFEAARIRFGTLPKRDLMQHAIELAREGFPIHPFLYGYMFCMCGTLGKTVEGRSIYMPDGALLSPGQLLRQPGAARTLERLRDEGNAYFYHGEFARKLVNTVREAGGVLSLEDLERYEVRWQEPARGTYREYSIAASPPPDNGGTHVIEALNMLEILDVRKLGHPTESGESLFWMSSISELVKDDGAKQPDPATYDVPLDVILSKEYAAIRLELLRMGIPATRRSTPAYPGSNHVTVVDKNGNVASIFHSCMSDSWSNGLFCEGVSICAGGVHFLRIMPRPGGRATLFLAPSIVFQNGKPVLASGSPSVGLISNILQNTTNVLDFGLNIEESVHRPRFGNRKDKAGTMIEADLDNGVRRDAELRGQTFEVVNPWNYHCGSFEGIVIDQPTGEASACADPRRAGEAVAT
jgi:gamma-glutamyltranspeptidase/glutathione hydrolase